MYADTCVLLPLSLLPTDSVPKPGTQRQVPEAPALLLELSQSPRPLLGPPIPWVSLGPQEHWDGGGSLLAHLLGSPGVLGNVGGGCEHWAVGL